MIGRVKLKSKRAAFSISSAREGGAKDREVTVKREMDLRVAEENERICWDFKNFGVGIFGIESWELCWSFGLEGKVDAMGTIGFEEAMIMLAMASGLINQWK